MCSYVCAIVYVCLVDYSLGVVLCVLGIAYCMCLARRAESERSPASSATPKSLVPCRMCAIWTCQSAQVRAYDDGA